MRPHRVLVLSNSVEQSGAPIALLRSMKWCVAQRIIEPTFFVRTSGELLEEFRSLGPTYLLTASKQEKAEKLVSDLPGGGLLVDASSFMITQWLRRLCRRRQIEFIYGNTATHARVISSLASLHLPVVTHVHELELALRQLDKLDELETLIAQSRRLLAVSGAVRRMLTAHGADEHAILEVPGMLSDASAVTANERGDARRHVLMADDDAVIVAACGSPSLIKGTDVFLIVARRALSLLSSTDKDRIVFRWIGALPGNDTAQAFVFDTFRLGLEGRIVMLPRIDRADRLLAAVDIFLSPSREDANPLSAMEAAALGCPVICFRGAGGADELADAGGAVAVPYLDVDAMAAALVNLFRSTAERTAIGDAARRYALSRHSPDAVGTQLADVFAGLWS